MYRAMCKIVLFVMLIALLSGCAATPQPTGADPAASPVSIATEVAKQVSKQLTLAVPQEVPTLPKAEITEPKAENTAAPANNAIPLVIHSDWVTVNDYNVNDRGIRVCVQNPNANLMPIDAVVTTVEFKKDNKTERTFDLKLPVILPKKEWCEVFSSGYVYNTVDHFTSSLTEPGSFVPAPAITLSPIVTVDAFKTRDSFFGGTEANSVVHSHVVNEDFGRIRFYMIAYDSDGNVVGTGHTAGGPKETEDYRLLPGGEMAINVVTHGQSKIDHVDVYKALDTYGDHNWGN